MSEPEPESPPSEPAPSAAPRLLVAARIVVPLALALVGYSVLIAQRWSVDHELQLVAPEVADPDVVPVLTFVFADGGTEDAGELAAIDVEVELVCGERIVARATAFPGALRSGETALDARAAAGACELRASAVAPDHTVLATARRPIAIDDAAPLPSLGRLATELQLLAVGPVVAEDGAGEPPTIAVRVSNGACVPEQPCEVLVHAAGVDAIALEDAPSATTTEVRREGEVFMITLVAHGPEASVVLVASRDGARVAHADVRLPIALATPWIAGPHQAVLETTIPIDLAPPVGRDAVIVDEMVDGRWRSSWTEHGGRVTRRMELPGVHRLQVRGDPFGGEHVASHVIVVLPPDQPIDAEIVRTLLAREGTDLPDPPGTPWPMLLASAEEEIRQLPAATSGLEADRARLAARQRTVQIVGAIALGLGIVVFLLSLLRRGLRAAQEARDVMTEAGDETATSRATRVRMTIAVIAFVGAVAVALLAGAALVLARAALVP